MAKWQRGFASPLSRRRPGSSSGLPKFPFRSIIAGGDATFPRCAPVKRRSPRGTGRDTDATHACVFAAAGEEASNARALRAYAGRRGSLACP
jgi:hypothetical protein